jgi:hypothetical protein
MKTRIFSTLMVCLAAGLLLCSTAWATGIGIFYKAGYGASDWEVEWSDRVNNAREVQRKDSTHTGVGFVMDTALAKNKTFNYRLNLGYEKIAYKPGDGVFRYDLKGLVLDNDFGFAVVRSPVFRLWLGPEVRISWYQGHLNSDINYDIRLFGLGFGPVIGANFNIGPVVTLSFKGGYLFTQHWGTGEDNRTVPVYPDIDSADVSGGHAYGNVSILFRFDDDR